MTGQATICQVDSEDAVVAKYFGVNLAQGMSNVKLDSMGRATVQYTAKNVSAAPIDGQGVLVSLPHTDPPAGVVEKGWVKIDGSAQRHFDTDREEVFVVKIAVPPNSPPGNYTFRLDVVSVARPDEGDAAPAVAFKVSGEVIPKGGGSKWLLIVLAIVLVLAVGVVAIWLIARKSGGTTTQTGQPQTQPGKPPQPNPLPYGPDTCKQGFVWREAVPSDHVCVTPVVRAQTAQDNTLAVSRRNPSGGPYGPDTCIQGYVWREAFSNDRVCVPGQTRAQAAADNAQAASRKAQP